MHAAITSPVPLVRADGAGYTFAGESVDGFDDRPDLAQSLRVRVARLGERYAPEKLSTAQRERLTTPLAERDAAMQPSRALDRFHADAVDAERAWEDGVYARLSAAQREWVTDPGSHPLVARGTRYPLTLRHLSLLSGLGERELRRWVDDGLIPAHPACQGRCYFSVAVARVLQLAQTLGQNVEQDRHG